MKRILKKFMQNLNFIAIIIALISIFVSSVLITYNKTNVLIYSYFLIGIGVVSIIVYAINKIINFKFSKLEIAIFALVILTLLSLIGTIDYDLALWGMINRREGLFTILTYYALALLSSTIKDKKKIKIIIAVIITVGLSNVIYGLFQTNWIKQNVLYIMNKKFYAMGFVGSTMFYGSLLSICYPIILGLFIKEKNIKKSVLYGILLVIFTFGTLISGSMAVLLANAIIFCFAFIKCLMLIVKTKSKEKLIEIIKILFGMVMFIICVFMVKSKSFYLKNDLKEMTQQMSQTIATGKMEDNFGTNRIYIWKNTIAKIKEHFWFGVGIDNFSNAFSKPLFEKKEDGRLYYINKAHNEYLQIMLCEGFFTGIYYIALLLAIGIKNIKTEDNTYYALLLGFLCYSIQAFFGISVTRVAPIFFIIVGLLMGNQEKSNRTKKETVK